MNVKQMLKSMTAEEIEDELVGIIRSATRDADRNKALETLCKIKRMIGHGNQEKKDFREVIVGSDKELRAGESKMTDE